MAVFQHLCRHLRTLFVSLALGGAVLAQANLIAHVSRDYLGNVPATDRFWFYKNLDGSPRPGGGLYPSLEYVYNRSENFPVVSVRANTIVVVVKFANPQPFSWVVGDFYYWQTPWVWRFLGLVYGPYTIHSVDPLAVGMHQDIKVIEVIQ